MSGMKRAGGLLVLSIVVVFVLLLAAIAIPNSDYNTYKGRQAEVRVNLHNIQLSVEQYAVDHHGTYPRFLTGGEARWSTAVDMQHPADAYSRPADAFSGPADCPERQRLTDPLLREGYIDSYPRNPFTRNGVTVHQAQLGLPLNASSGDPLRNGCGDRSRVRHTLWRVLHQHGAGAGGAQLRL